MWSLKVCKYFSTSSYLSGTALSSISLIKQSAILNKFLNKQKKQKQFAPKSAEGISRNQACISESPTNQSRNRRVQVLNKLFMKNITDIMATSSTNTDLLDLNIEVTQVSISNDYKSLRVYWLSRGVTLCNDIEQRLFENSKTLRHELSQLRVMSNIPHIMFIKDKRQVLINEVEEKLKTADMGEENSDTEAEEQDKLEPELPVMPSNVFGLNRAKMIEKIRRDMRKHCCKQRERQPEDNDQSPFNYSSFIRKFVNKAGR